METTHTNRENAMLTIATLLDKLARAIAPIVNESVLVCATVLLHVFWKIEEPRNALVVRF